MIRALNIVAASLTALAICQHSYATDLLREQKIVEDMAPRTDVNEMVWLESSGAKFQALYREAVPKDTHGGVILLHDLDASPDAADILRPLRKRLPDRGWDSLSLQVPVREAGAALQDYFALLPEAVERIKAGIAYLQSKNIARITLIGHHAGALMTLRYLAETSDRTVNAAILIDLPLAEHSEQEQATLADLAKSKLPLLEILSSREQALTSESAQKRKRAMKNNPGYRQTVIADPEARFSDVEDLLTNRIHGWLMRLPPPEETQKAEPI